MTTNVESYFKEEFIPDTVRFREKQMQKLEDKLTHGRGAYCEGEKSTGKTLTALKLMEKKKQEGYTTIYFKTERAIMLDFKRAVENLFDQPISSREYAPHVLFEKSNDKILMVWDDIQKIMSHVAFNNFCHGLYEHAVEYHKEFRLILVGTEKYPRLIQFLRADVQSRYQFSPIIFAYYNAMEINEILKDRLKIAHVSYDDNAVSFIAAKIRRLASDLRLAFEIIRNCVPLLNDKLTLGMVNEAWERTKTDYWTNQITTMDTHTQLLLFVATKIAKEKDDKEISTLDINGVYRQFCYDNHIDPLYPQRTNYLIGKLEKDHWFTKIGTESKGRGGRALTLRYEMTPETVEKSFEKIFAEDGLVASAPFVRQETLTSQEKIE